MNYLLLAVAGIMATILYGIIYKKKPRKKVKCGFLGLGISGDFGGGEEEASSVQIPKYESDPYYQKSQDTSYQFGTDILAGKLPDFYSSLGKTGSPEFNNMLEMINRDTAKSVNENLVRRNISRGGVGLSTIAKATADTGKTLRWSDFLRAQGEKAGLLTTGLNTVAGVRSGALSEEQIKNQFSLGATGLSLKQEEINASAKASQDAMWGQILSSTIGAAGMVGAMALAPATGGASLLALPALGSASSASAGVGGSSGFAFGR
jgi:hypothetical protein